MSTATKKVDLAGITTQIHGLLDPLEPAERQRAITAALTLLGDTYVFPAVGQAGPAGTVPSPVAHTGPQASGAGVTPRDFFATKDPKNKVEELAVAARYRELYESAESHTREQLAQVIKAARRNFDGTNFSRDLGNAKTSKLFSLGKDNALSYTGQQFVDALPDRDQALGLRKGKMAKRARKEGKAKA
jgi:hypothetical protein